MSGFLEFLSVHLCALMLSVWCFLVCIFSPYSFCYSCWFYENVWLSVNLFFILAHKILNRFLNPNHDFYEIVFFKIQKTLMINQIQKALSVYAALILLLFLRRSFNCIQNDRRKKRSESGWDSINSLFSFPSRSCVASSVYPSRLEVCLFAQMSIIFHNFKHSQWPVIWVSGTKIR